jgi:hypothetical protein
MLCSSQDWPSFQSHDSSILLRVWSRACLLAWLIRLTFCSKCILVFFFESLLLVLLARAGTRLVDLLVHLANVTLCSNFPVQAGQPSPYPPSMNTSIGGQRVGGQNGTPTANPANGQNGTPTFNNYRFTPTQPNGPNSPGFGSPDFGGAFSQQFPPPQ